VGLFARQRAKHDERIKGAASDKLRPGETIVFQLGATSLVSWFRFFLAVFPGAFLLEYTGRGYSSWMVGLAVGIWIGFVTRQYMLVLTDQRFLALRLRRMSSTKVDDVSGCESSEVMGIEFDKGVLNGKLTVRCGSTEHRFGIARVYEERAKQIEAAVQKANH